MRRKLTIGLASVAVLFLGACSTSKLAQSDNNNDDVYNTVARAKEQPKYEEKESSYRTDEQLYGGNNYSDEYDAYEGEYASRLNRFYYNTPWRSYYDSWYSYRYDPLFDNYYGYNNFYRPGFSINVGWGSPWYNNNYYWGYYGSPYYSRYWGPYSYYNVYPGYYGYGGGYYGGGYYGRPVYASPNYRTRPGRETNIRRGNSIYSPGRNRGTIGTTGRPERYEPGAGRTSSRPAPSGSGSSSSSRPSRPSRSNENTTPRQSTAPRQEPSRPVEYSRPERSSGSSSDGGSSRSSGGSSSGGSSSGGGRPSRGGR